MAKEVIHLLQTVTQSPFNLQSKYMWCSKYCNVYDIQSNRSLKKQQLTNDSSHKDLCSWL